MTIVGQRRRRSGVGRTAKAAPTVAHRQPLARAPARLECIERKSTVLKPSTLGCIANVPTVNITQGCAHRCVYCYARAYPTYPGDDRVLLYVNLAEKIRDELARKRRWPEQVYFCSSSDCFGPYAELQRETYRVMELLLERGIRVAFLTKGRIEPAFFELFRRFPDRVDAQIGLMSLDPALTGSIEPFAATPRQRLENIYRLGKTGVRLGARIDPIIPGVTDTFEELTLLLREFARRGIDHVAASYLFLRAGIRWRLGRELRPMWLRDHVLAAYRNGPRIVHRASPDGHGVIALPAERRRRGFDRIRTIAERLGIRVHICSCKNSDLGINDRCNITPTPPSQPVFEQLTLFDD